MDRNGVAVLLVQLNTEFKSLSRALNEFTRAIRPEVNVAESWPVYNSDYGDVICARESCGCEDEDSVILSPFQDLTYPPFPPYTARQLLDAVEQHVVNMEAKKEEDQDEH